MSTNGLRKALVTGAGMGIGQGIALELARQGYAVAVQYASSRAGAEETVAEIHAEGGTAVAIGGDLRVVSECRRVVDEAASALGGLNALVNNAGVTRSTPFTETTEETYAEMFELNIRGYYFCAQRAVKYLEQEEGGAIVNISSIHAYSGYSGHTAYAATKGAINAFTRTLAIELAARRIRVNCIGPGLVEVPRYFDNPDYTREGGNKAVPIGRVGLPHDIGTVAAFLCSPGAGYVTGQVIYVDGGSTSAMGLPRRS